MSESYEELIAARDDLIKQLQGQWDIQSDKKATNRLAIRTAGLVVVAGFVLLAVMSLSLLFVDPAPSKTGEESSIGYLFLMFVPFFGSVGLLIFAGIHVHAMWWRRLNPLHVDGAQLVWKKRKGHVPERLNLHALTEVTGYQGEGVGGGKLFIWVVNLFGESTFSLVNPCIFVSKGDLSPPKISGAMFQDGNKLIGLLVEIGEVNTKLAEFKSDQPD